MALLRDCLDCLGAIFADCCDCCAGPPRGFKRIPARGGSTLDTLLLFLLFFVCYGRERDWRFRYAPLQPPHRRRVLRGPEFADGPGRYYELDHVEFRKFRK